MPNIPSKSAEIFSVSDVMSADLMIREIVQSSRSEGLNRAFAKAARVCRITERRVKAFWYGELADWKASEDRQIAAGYAAFIENHLRQLDAQQALLTARLNALKDRK